MESFLHDSSYRKLNTTKVPKKSLARNFPRLARNKFRQQRIFVVFNKFLKLPILYQTTNF